MIWEQPRFEHNGISYRLVLQQDGTVSGHWSYASGVPRPASDDWYVLPDMLRRAAVAQGYSAVLAGQVWMALSRISRDYPDRWRIRRQTIGVLAGLSFQDLLSVVYADEFRADNTELRGLGAKAIAMLRAVVPRLPDFRA